MRYAVARARRVNMMHWTTILALVASACGGGEPSAAIAAQRAIGDEVPIAVTSSVVQSVTVPETCVGGSDAHPQHKAQGYACTVCHPCGGELAFASITFPGGTSTAGGVIDSTGGAPTCSVGCHNPLGAQNPPVAWTAGPLDCSSCHSNVAILDPATVRSSHLASGSASPSCTSCHDQTRHTEGEVRLLNSDGSVTSGSCTGCHSGQGQTLDSRTPPLLVGWSDARTGDFHGSRPGTCRFDRLDSTGQRSIGEGGLQCPADQPQPPGALRITSRWWYRSGTSGPWAWTCDIETLDAQGNRVGAVLKGQPCPQGSVLNTNCNNPANPTGCYPTTLVTRGFGGTLLPPFVRGQGALACGSCHDAHASTNAFLLAAQVNGVAIAPGTIDRAGVGAQSLCNACHAGERHEVCKTCHKERYETDGEGWWFEGAPVDPAPDGSACFYCHGHEGIRHMDNVSPAYPNGHPYHVGGGYDENDCSHCHSGWAPPPTEYAPPSLSYGAPPVVTGITATTATVSWRTNERATSYIEYGVGTAGFVAGSGEFVHQHSVTLTGLAPSTTYVWRVRTSDWFHNETRTPLQTFTTPGANAVPRPDLAPVYAGVLVGTYTTVAQLPWFPVIAPSGTPVEYEVQLASDAQFTHLVNGSMAGPGVPGSTIGNSGWTPGTPTTVGGKAALSYPATLTNIPQDWCGEMVPNIYFWRVRARDAQGNVSDWSETGTFGTFAGDPYC